MTEIVAEWLRRSADAMASGWEGFAAAPDLDRGIEAGLARMAHAFSAVGLPAEPSSAHAAIATQPPGEAGAPRLLTPEMEEDARVLPSVEEYLERGKALRRWWREVEANGGPAQKFPLERSFNQPTRSYGFYGTAPVAGTMLPVMGNVQEVFYDQVRAPKALGKDTAEWLSDQLAEFVMKYFMRISSFRQPEAYTDTTQPVPPPALTRLSWCPNPRDARSGFGFSQLFNKAAGSNTVYPFPSYDRAAIVDQRDIGKLYEWVLLKVRIFDFNFNFRPFGENGPELVFGENEQSYLVVHKDFLNYRIRPIPGVLGEYGIGYAFIRSPVQGAFGYGPGEFEAALELINFRIYETGYISVRMIFIANRPNQITKLVIDPVDISFRFADLFSFGLASRFLAPAKIVLDRLPLRFSVDPVSAYVSGANLVSGAYAARILCISREQLEKFFLMQHFKQHYETLNGSLITWRQIPDWLDTKSLPAWVVSGLSS
jgi:hypothetical protein